MLMVGEGIETCLTAMQATGHPAWAALSTSGLRTLDLPESVREVIVLADGDDPGEAAARDCALRWQRQGRRVRIARPPRGQDFNDMLTGSASLPPGGLEMTTEMLDKIENPGCRSVARRRMKTKTLSPPPSVRPRKSPIPIDGLIDRVADNPGVPFAPEVLERLSEMKKEDQGCL